MRCRTCRQPVHTYRPTGFRIQRAEIHNSPTYLAGINQVCIGSYGPVDDGAVSEDEFEQHVAHVNGQITSVLAIPPARFGARRPPCQPCYCGPEARAAQTHEQTCPRWLPMHEADR